MIECWVLKLKKSVTLFISELYLCSTQFCIPCVHSVYLYREIFIISVPMPVWECQVWKEEIICSVSLSNICPVTPSLPYFSLKPSNPSSVSSERTQDMEYSLCMRFPLQNWGLEVIIITFLLYTGGWFGQ